MKIHARHIAKGLLALCTTALPVGAGRLVDLDLTKHLVGVQPKDGIPALTNPDFVDPAQADYLAEDDLILGVSLNGEAKAYPENLGWRHEIINDQVGGRYISVTFCPLTGTGLVFDATDEAEEQFQLRVFRPYRHLDRVRARRRRGTHRRSAPSCPQKDSARSPYSDPPPTI